MNYEITTDGFEIQCYTSKVNEFKCLPSNWFGGAFTTAISQSGASIISELLLYMRFIMMSRRVAAFAVKKAGSLELTTCTNVIKSVVVRVIPVEILPFGITP